MENNSLRVLLEKTKLITKQTRDVFVFVSRHQSSILTPADFLIPHAKKKEISQNVYLDLNIDKLILNHLDLNVSYLFLLMVAIS